MIVVADTGPLLAAADRRDPAHDLAASLIVALGRDLLVPTPVINEVDHLLRARVGSRSARLFLDALATGAHRVGYLTAELLRRATGIDAQHADLDLGFADCCVMAIAEREDASILTFDFADFRAVPSRRGSWPLVVDESRYARHTR